MRAESSPGRSLAALALALLVASAAVVGPTLSPTGASAAPIDDVADATRAAGGDDPARLVGSADSGSVSAAAVRPLSPDEMRAARPHRRPPARGPAAVGGAEPDGPPGSVPGLRPSVGDGARGALDADKRAPRASSFVVRDQIRLQYPYRTVGKVFFKEQPTAPGFFECSGASVGGRAVWTAGHCLYTPGLGFHTNVVFVPAYRDGQAPFGQWLASNSALWTTEGWKHEWESFDYGAAIAQRNRSGRKLSEVVGALGFAWNQPRGTNFLALGYPVDVLDGQHLVGCLAPTTHRDPDPADPPPYAIGHVCYMGVGSSGGPWITGGNRLGGNISYGYDDDPDLREVTFSPYYTAATKAARDQLVAR